MTSSDRARAAGFAAVLAAAVLAAGCRRAEPGFHLLRLVRAKSYAIVPGRAAAGREGLTFRRAPEVSAITVDNERRPVVLSTDGTWSWRGRIPEGAHFHAGAQIVPGAWRAVRRLDVAVTARDGTAREILDVAHTEARRSPRWLDLDVDLSPWAGRTVTLELSAALRGLPETYRNANLVAWGPVVLEKGSTVQRRPNILFILVDTLRADHTTPYGYTVHDTTPEIQRRLADRGTVVEHAYSQAPWTLPSVVSFLTGRHPGELLGEDLASYGIPAGVPTLAERLAALGYETGGFFGNPALHAGAGFERGFDTFYAPPADVEWIRKHADEVNRHAVPWLRAHQSGPFFLYVHYIDPHDPYDNPDLVDGRAQFMPEYRGVIGTDWIHGIYSGKLGLENPELDIRYIKALYDGEVHYVDRSIGSLLAGIDPQVLANTLVVLTADHGEELHDHGGWKHGQTLYDEQIHVPLVVRWDGHVPAGRRLGGTVRLLDLMPTLTAAAGGAGDPAWQGFDLLPALTGRQPPPHRPAFSEGMSGGPLRAAAVLDGRKLIRFNREEPFRPADELQGYLWRKDLGRLQPAELYDLTRDGGERHNLAAERPQGLDRLGPVIDRQLGRELRGLWLLPDGIPAGSRLSGSIAFERPPLRWAPYFLGPSDRVEVAGSRVRFELAGERAAKGLRIDGDLGRVLALEASLDGRPLPLAAVRIGGGARWSGGPIAAAALTADGWPLDPRSAAAVLHLWRFNDRAAARRTESNPETEERLRNLGYIGARKRK